MGWGAAIGAAVSLIGGAVGNESNRKANKSGKSLREKYERIQLHNIEQGFGEQERLLKQANREELEGAEDAIARFEGAGTQAIEDERATARGGVDSALSSRGLLGSTVQANARIGIGRAAARGYMSLGEAVSSMRQSLASRKAAGTNRLGMLSAYKAQARNNVLAAGIAAQAGQSYQSQPLDFTGLGAAIGYGFQQQNTPKPSLGYGQQYINNVTPPPFQVTDSLGI